MYQRAEICLPRKKRVPDSFRSNTYRLFDETVPDRLNPDEVYKNHRYASRDAEEAELLKTHNVPQPANVKFIRTNVRFLNQPVALMETESAVAEQFNWWSNTVDKDVARKPVYSKDSTQRRDYQAMPYTPGTRVKEEKSRPLATGIIPTLSPLGQPKELVERMSFIHQFDSRRLQDQPYQGKRHGAFVWSERGSKGARHIPEHGGADLFPACSSLSPSLPPSTDVCVHRGPLRPSRP
ncbi:ciliary microtubule inner protein 6-like [Salminus brasiliensis]|uniref:ciliary microtubule inner protein 6-like n=1 Tax=Salminus brasiliensis TaxID=930266 RepID=UPI003B82EC84